MKGKVRTLTKKQLWDLMQKNSFSELFLAQPKKANDLFNDLWNKMTPVPHNAKQKILFESVYLEWQYLVEGEIK